MKNDKLTIFLSHSHKDEEKVRKIRDVFEILDCEPLIFFLKCLDDNNTELEDFIKKEIEARNIFLYCKSDNAEKSEWVQKELEYIKSLDEKRLYEIDIDKEFSLGIIKILSCIQDIIKSNKVFIVGSEKDRALIKKISDYLRNKGMVVIGEDLEKSFKSSIYNKNNVIINNIVKDIKDVSKEGKFIILCTHNLVESNFLLTVIQSIFNNEGQYIAIINDKEIFDQNIELDYYFGNRTEKVIKINKVITNSQLKEIYNKLIE